MSQFKIEDSFSLSKDITGLNIELASEIPRDISDNFCISRAKSTLLQSIGFRGNRNGKVILKDNWDLEVYNDQYLWVFSKTLDHNPRTLLPYQKDVDKLLDFFTNPSLVKLENLPSNEDSVRKLEDPLGGLGYEPICEHQSLIKSSEYIPLNSERGVMEMTEVYCMALSRDIKISDLNIDSDPSTIFLKPDNSDEDVLSLETLLSYMNSTSNKNPNWPLNKEGKTDLSLLFRGHSIGENIGQYVSQFLILDIPFANGNFEQLYIPESDSPSLSTKQGYLDVQNGKIGISGPSINKRRIKSLRDIGSLVHKDPAYGIFFNAALIASKAGLNALKTPGKGSNFLDGGGPDYLTSLAAVTRAALRTSWVTKWQNALKIRPENAAARLSWLTEFPEDKTNELSLWYNYFNPELLETICQWNNKFVGTNLPFLPSLYPEGSPTHPSFPAGHACVAGACVTIMKAFLKLHNDDLTPVKWTSVFGNIKKVSDTTGELENTIDSNETIVGELNKLASNVALGRDIAGVHYRCDGDCGLKMGERVAISYLKSMTYSYYPEIIRPNIEFILQKFDNQIISIQNGIEKIVLAA